MLANSIYLLIRYRFVLSADIIQPVSLSIGVFALDSNALSANCLASITVFVGRIFINLMRDRVFFIGINADVFYTINDSNEETASIARFVGFSPFRVFVVFFSNMFS